MKTTLITIGILVLVGIGGLYLTRTGNETSSPALPDNTKQFDKAPAFSLEDYNGNAISLSDFSEKIVVANSWTTWCPFCVDELPDFAALQKEFPNDIVVIAINRQESRNRAKTYTDNLHIADDIIVLLDPDDSFYRSIGGFAMPETLFIGPDGTIHVHKRGPMELEEMRKHIREILEQ